METGEYTLADKIISSIAYAMVGGFCLVMLYLGLCYKTSQQEYAEAHKNDPVLPNYMIVVGHTGGSILDSGHDIWYRATSFQVSSGCISFSPIDSSEHEITNGTPMTVCGNYQIVRQ